jgi:hypothetical protein
MNPTVTKFKLDQELILMTRKLWDTYFDKPMMSDSIRSQIEQLFYDFEDARQDADLEKKIGKSLSMSYNDESEQ